MASPGTLPIGDSYYATIRRAGEEEILLDGAGVKLKFSSSGAALRFAQGEIDRIDREWEAAQAAKRPETEEEISARLHKEFKEQQAERLRRERAAFDLRNVEVVVKKKRGSAR